jgi:hypothetical protein
MWCRYTKSDKLNSFKSGWAMALSSQRDKHDLLVPVRTDSRMQGLDSREPKSYIEAVCLTLG